MSKCYWTISPTGRNLKESFGQSIGTMALSAHHLKALAEILSIYMAFWCDGDGAGHEDPIDNHNLIRTVSSPQAVDIIRTRSLCGPEAGASLLFDCDGELLKLLSESLDEDVAAILVPEQDENLELISALPLRLDSLVLSHNASEEKLTVTEWYALPSKTVTSRSLLRVQANSIVVRAVFPR